MMIIDMSNTTTPRKTEVEKRLKEIGVELKNVSKKFTDIKSKTSNAVKNAVGRADGRKMDDLRKKIGA